jgi:hypothetical protein
MGKDLEGDGNGIIEVLFRYFPERMKITKTKPQDIIHPARDSNNALTDYRAAVLSLRTMFDTAKSSIPRDYLSTAPWRCLW